MEEVWKDIKGYEELYQISSLGNIKRKERLCVYSTGRKSLYKEMILKTRLNKDGYPRITLNKGEQMWTVPIHRLVASHFIENPDKLSQVNHMDGNKSNNSIGNLEWCGVYENLQHSYNEGLKKIKLTGEQVQEIRSLAADRKYTRQQIADMYGVHKSHVFSILNGSKRAKI